MCVCVCVCVSVSVSVSVSVWSSGRIVVPKLIIKSNILQRQVTKVCKSAMKGTQLWKMKQTWRGQVITVVLQKMQIFWDVTPYRPANSCRLFKGWFCFPAQIQAVLCDDTLLGHLAAENGDTKSLWQAGNYLTVNTARYLRSFELLNNSFTQGRI